MAIVLARKWVLNHGERLAALEHESPSGIVCEIMSAFSGGKHPSACVIQGSGLDQWGGKEVAPSFRDLVYMNKSVEGGQRHHRRTRWSMTTSDSPR